MQFNLSHSGGWVAVALHPREPVGVNVERDRPQADWPEILPLVRAQQDRVPSPLHLWTAKEAALKALGQGFLTDPRAVGIEGDANGFTCIVEGIRLHGDWHLVDDSHLLAIVCPVPVSFRASMKEMRLSSLVRSACHFL